MNKYIYNTKPKYRITRHMLFFVATVLVFVGILFMQYNGNSFGQIVVITFSNALCFFAYAYITIFLLIPEFLLKRKIIWFLLLFIVVGIGFSAIKLIFSDYIFYSSFSPENVERNGVMNLRFIVVNTKDMTFIVALFCIAKYVKDFLYAENMRKKLEAQNRVAQNKLMQSQFDSHFMFNTINNLYALSLLNPQKSIEVIRGLKKVLNYIIKESEKQLVSLKNEIELVENYIDLEKMRYGNRLKVDFAISGNVAEKNIPPMVLFLLTENSFKHGSSLDAGNPWINIEVKATTKTVMLVAENSVPKTLNSSHINTTQGKGFSSLKKRLDIIYNPKGYNLHIENTDDKFLVKLELKGAIEFRRNTYRK